MSKFIAIDIGNSTYKYGLFENETLLESKRSEHGSDVIEYTRSSQPDWFIISSVRKDPETFLAGFDRRERGMLLKKDTEIPIENKYESKHTLGLDRLAAAVGANGLFPNYNCLIIDIGTCITYDLVDRHNAYQGGMISPGVDIRLRSMHEFTANLPLLSFQENVQFIGKDTKSSMLSGVFNGTKAEIMQMIRMYESKFADLQIVICGGNSKNLVDSPPENVTFAPDLVLFGLSRILKHHVEKNV